MFAVLVISFFVIIASMGLIYQQITGFMKPQEED